MAYTFSGIFADGDEQVLSAVLCEVSGVGRLIEQPFRGFGVQFGEGRQQSSQGFPLVAWSRKFPAVTVVYLYVECFGGDCDHAGFAIRDGQVIEDIAFDESDVPLHRLLKHLGVQLGERSFFAPLQRGYFERAVHS
jgi:hypothetical protein